MADDHLYQIAEPVPLQATFRNSSGTPANPSGGVTLSIRKPDGTTLAPTPTAQGAGVYTYTVTGAQNNTAGVWSAAFTGTGDIAVTEYDTFVVEGAFGAAGVLSTRALVSLAEAREYVLGNRLDNSQDYKLARRVNAMSEAVYAYTNREWLPVGAATRKFFCTGRTNTVNFNEYDLVGPPSSVTAFTDYPTTSQTVLVAPTTVVEGDYRLGPVGGMKPAGTFKWLTFSDRWTAWWPVSWQGFEVTIIGTWGIGTVPEDVKEAVLIAVDESWVNPARGSSRVVGPFSMTEDVDVFETTGDAPWRALPGASRALLADYRDDPTPVLL